MNILVYDPFVHPDLAKDFGVTLTSLDQLVTESDYISIHAPLNKDTRHLIGTKELNLMKDSVFIVNTSRGGLIDEKALIDALRNKKIAGAALDVFDQEPINQDNPLLSMENVILSPHVGWYSEESQIDLQTKAAQGVADVLIGKKPQYLVNPEVWKD
jgi:D-3-phosphoglycerate dehydrogenase